jgi:prevent-host-death family protein
MRYHYFASRPKQPEIPAPRRITTMRGSSSGSAGLVEAHSRTLVRSRLPAVERGWQGRRVRCVARRVCQVGATAGEPCRRRSRSRRCSASAVRRRLAGRTVTVTDHGRPVARIVPVEEPNALERLVAEGRVELARARKRPAPKPIKTGSTVSDLIGDQRR